MPQVRAVVAIAFLLWSPLGIFAQALLYQVQGPTTLIPHGVSATGLGDVNGDAIPDLALAIFDSALGSSMTVVVETRSGADGSLIWQTSFAPQSFVGPSTFPSRVSVAGIGDLTGDGMTDLALGISRSGAGPGSVRVLDGATGGQLQILTSPSMGVTFGGTVIGVGDVNGDQVPDFAVGSPHLSPGWFQVHSGVAGVLLVPPTPLGISDGAAGSSLASVGDFNGDGSPDLAIGAPLHLTVPGLPETVGGTVFIVTAATGQVIATLDGSANLSLFGESIAGLGDINGDGLDDLVVGAPEHLSLLATSRIVAIAGGTGNVLWTVEHPLVSGDARSLTSIADVNGDGHRDVVVGNGNLSTTSYLISGGDGSMIAGFPAPLGGPWNRVADLGDINGDLAGDFVLINGNTGAIRVHSGADVSASVSILGSGGGPGPFFPGLAASLPVLPSTLDFSVVGAPPAAAGWLGLAPAPANPFSLHPGFVIHLDITRTASWAFLPVTTSVAGAWSLSVELPFHVTLLGRSLIAQAWFPSALGLGSATITNGLDLRLGL